MRPPVGFTVRLADGVLTLDAGRVLVGGSPLTAMRLTAAARRLLEHGEVEVRDDASAHLADRLLATNLGLPELGGQHTVAPEELTVVVPVRDRVEQLDRALTAVAGLGCIVVDDASLDPAAVAAVADRHGATYLPLTRNVGPAGARNAGLARVRTPFVAFVDSDVAVGAEDLLVLSRHLADPAVALVGPRVVGRSRASRPRWFERYDELASSLSLGTAAGSVRPGAAVAWLPSACLVARTEALDGGFDAELRVGEDVDLVWRLTRAGRRVRYEPGVEAHHDTRASMGGWLGRKVFYGSGSALLGARHGDAVAPAVLSPSYAFAGATLLLARPRLLPVAGVAVALGTRSVARTLPDVPGRTAVSARIAMRGLGWAVRQTAALLLRHWWPATVVGAAVSTNVRRAVVTAIVVDSAVAVTEQARLGSRLSPSMLLARRLDDLAYGLGLWCGSVRARSATALLPRVPTRRPAGRRARRLRGRDGGRP